MVRYPHIIVIPLEVEGHLENGEWVEGYRVEKVFKGSHFSSNAAQPPRTNVNGNYVEYHAEISTKQKPIDGAKRLRIDELNVDVVIIKWEQFQTHSVIYI